MFTWWRQAITGNQAAISAPDRKSTRLNSSHTEIYTLSLHDALPILIDLKENFTFAAKQYNKDVYLVETGYYWKPSRYFSTRSEEHTSELQSHRDLHSFPTRRSSDLDRPERELYLRG